MNCYHLAIIVSGGFTPDVKGGLEVELLHNNGSFWCKTPVTGKGRSLNGLTACLVSNCYTLEQKRWKETSQLQTKRFGHVSWTRPDGKIHLFGYMSSEIVTVGRDQSETGYPLKHYLL